MTDIKTDIEETLLKCLQLRQKDLLRDVMIYNDSMTISQVIKFFERQGLMFTKTMIQHYVRIGVIPPPEDKRRYTRLHLLMLSILEQMKGIYALDDIAAAFSGLTPAGPLIKLYQEFAASAVDLWRETLEALISKASDAANGMGLDERQTQHMLESFIMLGIMTQSAAAKQTALMIGVGRNEK